MRQRLASTRPVVKFDFIILRPSGLPFGGSNGAVPGHAFHACARFLSREQGAGSNGSLSERMGSGSSWMPVKLSHPVRFSEDTGLLPGRRATSCVWLQTDELERRRDRRTGDVFFILRGASRRCRKHARHGRPAESRRLAFRNDREGKFVHRVTGGTGKRQARRRRRVVLLVQGPWVRTTPTTHENSQRPVYRYTRRHL
jgi:hypothetical protein